MASLPHIAAPGAAPGALCLLLALTVSCSKEKKQPPPAPPAVQSSAPIKPPPAVLAHIGLQNPKQAVDDLLAIVGELTPLPLQRDGVLDLLAQQARLPRGMLEALDTTGSFWMVLLDDAQLGEQDPGVLVLPIRSRQEFEAALTRKMKKAPLTAKDRAEISPGALSRYEPKPGELGLQPILLEVGERYVLAPSSAKALAAAETFIRRSLLPQPPTESLALHLQVAPLLAGPGKELDSKVSRALKRLRSDLHHDKGLDEPVASVAEDSLRQYTELLRSAKELVLTARIDRQRITLTLRGEAAPAGKLQQLLGRQQVGAPYGVGLLPADSWLVLTNLSNPAARAERREQWDAKLIRSVKRLAPARRQRLQQALQLIGQSFTGDLSLALHRGARGSGLALSAVSRLQDGAAAGQALRQAADVLAEWLTAKQERSKGSGVEDEISLTRRPFAQAGSEGEILAFSFVLPPDKQKEFAQLLGPALTVGYALSETQGLLVAGKDAEKQLAHMAAGAAAGRISGSLQDNPAFVQAQQASPHRVGLLYLSLVDLARWFASSGIPEAETIAAAVGGQPVTSAPSANWGVDRQRSTFDATLHLPLAHFAAFKPLVDDWLKQAPPGLLAP